MRIPICKLNFFFLEAEVKVFMMLRTMCRGQKGKILRQYIIKSPFISLFCNEGRRQCCCYFFSLFVENVATSKKQEKNCSRISFFLYITIFMARWGLVLSKPRIHENWKDCFWFGKFSKSYEGHNSISIYISCSPLTKHFFEKNSHFLWPSLNIWTLSHTVKNNLLYTSVSANIISRA